MNDQQSSKQVSMREIEVLENISHGYTVKEIAEKLFLSSHTIISHKKNLCAKLQATNGPELVRRGFQLGYLSFQEDSY